MKINLITLDTVKSQLGIVTTDNDMSITSLIPIVSADVRRILNNQYSNYVSAVINKTGKTIKISDFGYVYRFIEQVAHIGTVIQSDLLSDDTYINGYDPNTGLYSLSVEPLTDSNDQCVYIYPTVNVSQWPTISKMIWYKFKQQSTDYDTQDITSESIGGMSFSYSNSEIDKRYDYPSKLIKDLGTPYARTC